MGAPVLAAAKVDAAAGRALRTVVLCFLAALAEGFDTQSMGVAAPGLAPALHLSRDQLGPAFSASVAGLLIGAALLGRVADRVGRKWTLIGSLAILGAFSLATTAAWSFESLLAIRFVTGLGMGGAMPNLIALPAEAAAVGRRARLVMVMGAGMPFGAAVAGAVAASLSWRWVFVAGGLGPLVLAPVIALALPESRRFIEARRAQAAQQGARHGYLDILFGPGRAVSTLLIWAAAFCALLSLYLLINWLPTLMGERGVGRAEASLVSLLFNLGGGIGVLILASLMDRRRRSLWVAGWYVGLAVSLILLAGARADLPSAGGAGFAVGVFISSAPMLLYGLAPGFYAVAVRASGVGAMVAVGRLGAIIGPLLAAALLAAGASPSGVLLMMLPLAAAAGAASLALLGRPVVVD